MLKIDGSQGEGGGQVLRTALSLSLLTGRPFEISGIRAGRERPGLMRQHLTAVLAAAAVGEAEVDGASVGSRRLRFEPGGTIRGGDHRFAVGTAGSAVLVLQTVLVPLLLAPEATTLVLEGGTHNPAAPPFEFLDRVFIPALGRMGARVTARLDRRGFYPAGGGRIEVQIDPVPSLEPIHLAERGEALGRSACAIVENLPVHIAERELSELAGRIDIGEDACSIVESQDSPGPGNVLLVELEYENVTEVFCGFGTMQRSAEVVARGLASEVKQYLAANVPVGRYLADQLLVPMAIGGGGTFRSLALSLHAETVVQVIHEFMDVAIAVERDGRNCTVTVG